MVYSAGNRVRLAFVSPHFLLEPGDRDQATDRNRSWEGGGMTEQMEIAVSGLNGFCFGNIKKTATYNRISSELKSQEIRKRGSIHIKRVVNRRRG